MKTIVRPPTVCLLLGAFASCVMSWSLRAEIPANFRIMDGSASPYGSLAVLEPVGEAAQGDAFWKLRNQLFDTKSQSVIGAIEGVPGMKQMNHGGASARWSSQSDLLLWYVDGKWGPRSATFVQIKEGKITSQLDVVKAGYDELLKRAKKAYPKTYAAAKKRNEGSGSALPDGFAANVSLKELPDNALPKFSVEFVVTMTANPKGMEDFPAAADIEGFLFGKLDTDLKIKWGESAIYNAAARERLFSEGEGADEGIAHLSDEVATSLSKEAKTKFEAEMKAWDDAMIAADDKWPVRGSVSTCLGEKLRQDASEKQIEKLEGMLPKKKKK